MEPRVQPLPFAELAQLDVHTAVGTVSLVPLAEGEQPRVEVAGELSDGDLQIAREGDVVRASFSPAGGGFFVFGAPDVRLAFHVPPNVRARVRTEFGRIRAERLDKGCELDLATSAGMIALDQVVGRLVLRASAGTISGQALAGSFDVESSAGSVRLGINGLEPGEHRVRTQMGSVRLELAKDLAVEIKTRASMGSARSRYPSTPGAPAVLVASAELGSVKIGESPSEQTRHGDFPRWEAFGSWDPGQWPLWPRWQRRAAAPPRPPEPPRPSVGDEELKRILAMVEQGKITAAEAERLIRAIERR